VPIDRGAGEDPPDYRLLGYWQSLVDHVEARLYHLRNAAARDVSMELVGVHGSMSAAVWNVFSSVSKITKVVGRALTI